MSTRKAKDDARNEELEKLSDEFRYLMRDLIGEARLLGRQEYRVEEISDKLRRLWDEAFGIAP